MKPILATILLALCLTSCAEEFEYRDPAEFNASIVNRKDISLAEELIMLYYNTPPRENTSNIIVSVDELENNRWQATLIQDGLEDDSQAATKVVMTASRAEEHWEVLEIKTNWRCYHGRGHTSWGIAWCN